MKYGWGKEIAGLWRNLKVQGAQTGLEIQFGSTGSLMGNCKGINLGLYYAFNYNLNQS